MELIKTNEKLLIWMHRENITGQQIASKIGITRQAWSNKLKSNIFSVHDIITVNMMGFKD